MTICALLWSTKRQLIYWVWVVDVSQRASEIRLLSKRYSTRKCRTCISRQFFVAHSTLIILFLYLWLHNLTSVTEVMRMQTHVPLHSSMRTVPLPACFNKDNVNKWKNSRAYLFIFNQKLFIKCGNLAEASSATWMATYNTECATRTCILFATVP